MRSDDYRAGYREGFRVARAKCAAYMRQLREQGRLIEAKSLTPAESAVLEDWERETPNKRQRS